MYFDEAYFKGNDIQNTISQYIEKISNLNDQISQTDQKLQDQMMRIPDFPQLHQALDRTLAQTKKYQEELMQKKYLLDEIGDRNRLLDQMEIQESKNRMSQLKILMPFRDQENNDDIMKQLPEMLAERAKQQKEFEIAEIRKKQQRLIDTQAEEDELRQFRHL